MLNNSATGEKSNASRASAAGLSIALTYPYPLGKTGGGARTVREIARHLGRSGAKVVLLAVSATPNTFYPRPGVEDRFLGGELDAELGRDSVEIVRIPQHPLHHLCDACRVRKAMAQLLKERDVDVVLGHHTEAATLPTLLRSRGIKIGYIASWQYRLWLARPELRGWKPEWLWRRMNNASIIRPHRQADIIFATSRFTREELIEVVGVEARRIVVCYLGVEPAFAGLRRPAPKETSRFIFFGTVVQSKGVLDAIQALGQLARNGFTNWTYRILGAGDLEGARRAAHEHGIGDQVVLCGPVKTDELLRELEEAHLAIMPSYYESFGLSVAEAQAAAIPVVAYRVGAVPEVVEDGVSGWLVPFGAVEQLAHRIQGAVEDPEMTHRAGLAGRKRVAERFTWQRTAATILEGIQTIR